MDPVIIALITVGLLVLAILFGVDVGVALGVMSFLGAWAVKGNSVIALRLLEITSFTACMEYVLAVVPMFILMGLFGNLSGASDDVYDAANLLFSKVRGGLGIATVIANAVFAAITGSSAASAAVFSKIAYPQMKRLGYKKEFNLGTIVGSSVLGMLIPPSALFIIYGYLTEQSIGKLFIAGVIPGIILTAIFCLGIWAMVTARPNLGGRRPDTSEMTSGALLRAVTRPWIYAVLIFIVLGGIYLGWFTPTEAGAVGAFGAFVYCLVKGKVTSKSLWRLLLDAGYTVGSMFFLFIGAQMYSRMLALSTLPTAITEYVTSLEISPFLVIVLFLLIYLILGAILDSISILLITTPIMFPIVVALGFDPIWYGVIAVITIEMGLLTPPFGMCVFVMKSALGNEVTVVEGFRGAIPFLGMMLVCLFIVSLLPKLSTWLPSMM
ncbi:MAG: TRAP transporter large permease [Thermodesulfobacteriota bacterium]